MFSALRRLAIVIICWVGFAAVAAAAFKALPVPVSVHDVIVIHAQLEEMLARQEMQPDG